MLEVLIADLFDEEVRYTVVSDIDVEPMESEQLFNSVTVKLLNEQCCTQSCYDRQCRD